MGRIPSDPRLPAGEARTYNELIKLQAERGSDDEPNPGDVKQFLALLCGAAALVLKTRVGAWSAAFLCASCLATMRSAEEFKHIFTTITYVACDTHVLTRYMYIYAATRCESCKEPSR